MRRRRSHRPGRVTARVIAAGSLALIAGAAAIVTASASTITVGPISVSGSPTAQPDLGSTGLIGISGLPAISLPPALGGGTPTPPPVPSSVGGVTVPCVTSCTPSSPGGGNTNPTNGGGNTNPTNSGGNTNPTNGGGNQTSAQGAGGTPGTSTTGSGSGGTSGTGSGGIATAGSSGHNGLNGNPPPPVEQLTPLAGINFGQAPYLWPLFLLLDVIAAGAVVLVVRKTWSTAGAD
jgi:hypothetical protein